MNRALLSSTATLSAEEMHRLADHFEKLRTAPPPAAEPGEVAEINASALPPVKAVGDLAQVSTGVTGSQSELIGLMDWSIKWKRGVVNSTTTDGNGYASKLASTAEWTATAKFAYIDGDATQAQLRAAITTLQYASSEYNFTNAPGIGRDSYKGNGILTGIDFSTGTGKIFGMDITIEGDGPLAIVPQLAPATGTGSQSTLVAEN